ncbi:MAG: hypothetical protein U9R14_00015, partial [Patescibacteria group bacterium]|nr:hypothetical protein [Patescibacteria group bacterium]
AVFGLSVEFYFSKKINLKIIISSIGGILVGIIIHPNSLNYCYVMFIHFWQVLYLKFSGIPLGIGGELHILSFAEFLRGHFLNLLFFAIAIALFAAFKKIRVNKYCLIINSLFLISCFWFLVALFVPRGIEYWCPFAWLFIALIFSFFAKTIEFNQIKKFIKEKINFKILLFFVHSFIIILVFYNFSQIFYHIYQKNNNNPDYYFQQANKWLKQNTEKNSIIFYNNWSFWPRMFFYNHYNHYIIGMDPTFLYEYDSELALIWRNISYHGIYCNQQDICMDLSPKAKINYISQTIKNNFKANYIITKNNPKLFLVKILANKKNDFKKVYENKGLLIYQITIP